MQSAPVLDYRNFRVNVPGRTGNLKVYKVIPKGEQNGIFHVKLVDPNNSINIIPSVAGTQSFRKIMLDKNCPNGEQAYKGILFFLNQQATEYNSPIQCYTTIDKDSTFKENDEIHIKYEFMKTSLQPGDHFCCVVL